MNKTNILAVGVLLIALSLYLQVLYNNPGRFLRETIERYIEEDTFIYLTTMTFSTGLIIVIISILIKPSKRVIALNETPPKGATYNEKGMETVEKEALEQTYEEGVPAEEYHETVGEEALEGEEEPEKAGEVIGFCPRCGAPVSEGMRYCRKCGLKLK